MLDLLKTFSLEKRIEIAKKTKNKEVIEFLANDDDEFVRVSIASRADLSKELIEQLANDDDY